MAKIFHTVGEPEKRGYEYRNYEERDSEYAYNQKSYDEDHILEKAFKEGCEHGYHKAMRELEGYNERGGRIHFKEDFEEKIERLKEKYK